MTPKRGLHPMLSLAILIAVFVVGCAASQSVTLPGPAALEARQRLMKAMGGNWADAQAKFKAGNVEGVAVNAENIALMADQIPGLFPLGSMVANSKAKPEVWDQGMKFTDTTKNSSTLAAQLRDAARSKNAPTTEAIMKDFGPKACGSCHTPFRQPAR
jgi:cytochrome c556